MPKSSPPRPPRWTSGRYQRLTGLVRDVTQTKFPSATAFYRGWRRAERPESEWVWPDHAAQLEAVACDLTEAERTLLVVGDDETIRKLVARTGCKRLRQFVLDVADGDLCYNFHAEE